MQRYYFSNDNANDNANFFAGMLQNLKLRGIFILRLFRVGEKAYLCTLKWNAKTA